MSVWERKNAKQLPKLLASQGKLSTVNETLPLVFSFFYIPLYSPLSWPPLLSTCLTSSSHQLLYFSITPLSSSSDPASVASLISPQILPPSQYFPSSNSSPCPFFHSSTRILLPTVPSEHCSVTAQLVMACQETAPFVPRWKGLIACECVCGSVCMCEWSGWWWEGGQKDWHGHPSTASARRAYRCHRDFSRACPHQLSVVDNWDITLHTHTHTHLLLPRQIPPTAASLILLMPVPLSPTHTYTLTQKLNNLKLISFSASHNKDTKGACVFWSPVEHDSEEKK